ncbi:Hypothetical_protein [Hexamita inflata]|uniref:Hypothetical_protein n=1 Tax=Hexamita inflata TaxID=28002 RepID=A0AA86QNR4_9EUKA|nr:Hypothetical protein HINF_LOCUS44103 [Hexamita inflata]CAI9956464.1 Hypothetical protein HINF_LOCUS44109 [Hexamita inflata]
MKNTLQCYVRGCENKIKLKCNWRSWKISGELSQITFEKQLNLEINNKQIIQDAQRRQQIIQKKVLGQRKTQNWCYIRSKSSLSVRQEKKEKSSETKNVGLEKMYENAKEDTQKIYEKQKQWMQ